MNNVTFDVLLFLSQLTYCLKRKPKGREEEGREKDKRRMEEGKEGGKTKAVTSKSFQLTL